MPVLFSRLLPFASRPSFCALVHLRGCFSTRFPFVTKMQLCCPHMSTLFLLLNPLARGIVLGTAPASACDGGA